ncbi:hypothetical protein GCM10009678_44500 [Actinomadura kijaniata]|uniref:Uncharacterized protein n=1 Tax=Actinomadura namibiensis TaxID=182080 RepID=A0A7W3QNA9_ACTNM|nr:hypothetical protein [Actinomadura namibiensis]MBA8952858.1 hypothetical protein [Actinomadura namibiensis]
MTNAGSPQGDGAPGLGEAGDDEPAATMDRPWFTGALAADTAPRMLDALVAATTTVLELVAPTGRVPEAAAASDPEVAALWPRDVDPRHVVHRTAAEAADLPYGLLSPDPYLPVRARTRLAARTPDTMGGPDPARPAPLRVTPARVERAGGPPPEKRGFRLPTARCPVNAPVVPLYHRLISPVPAGPAHRIIGKRAWTAGQSVSRSCPQGDD